MKAFEEQIEKYVRLPGNEIIIFSKSIEHLAFKHLNPITAGSCIINATKKKVHCFGVSITLHLQADEKKYKDCYTGRYLVIKIDKVKTIEYVLVYQQSRIYKAF